MPERQRNPEKMLVRAKEEEVKQHGKLKIYLGAAPGVGKTYSMLADALSMREQGLDVIAGVVESHARKEIDAMLQGLEVLPRKIVDYHGKPLLEFDLDAALARNPGLVLIDEMAHTNIPGLRHAKRWQDIKELLDRGINVYTTLNVQHIESLNNIITQIVGVKVRETVPDFTLELADTIELVDLPPDDLLRRLQEGKVYIPAQAELATQHFFRKGNLTALRELALRYTAAYVDEQVLIQRRGQGIEQTWPTAERLLVCIGPGSNSTKVIRAAKRMAMSLRAEWIALHIESPQIHLSEEQKTSAIQNLRLAEQLGAETRVLSAVDVPMAIIAFARDRNVTKIITNKHDKPRWKEFLFGSLVEQLVRKSGDIDIYIIHADAEDVNANSLKNIFSKKAISLWAYSVPFMVVAVVTGLDLMLYSHIAQSNLLAIYILGVVFVAMTGRIGPSLLAALLSVVAYLYYFIPPRYGFVAPNLDYATSLFVMLFIGFIVSYLTHINREQAHITHLGEQRTVALHALTRQLASTRGIDKLLEIAVNYISTVFNSEVLAILPENNQLKIYSGGSAKKDLNPKDEGVAQWVYDLGQIAGLGTDTLPFSDAVYVPLLGSHGPVGVLKIRPRQAERLLIPEQLRLLEACCNQIASALEVDRLQEKAKESQIAIETERLRTALFSSVSHELQTPLAVIVRLVNNLRKHKNEEDAILAHELINDIAYESERLNRLINNLLQITQLEEGKIKLHKKPRSIDDLIQASLHRIEKRLGNKPYKIQIPPNLPLISFDKVLMEQVLVNLIENAILYTPEETPIEISVSIEDDHVLVSVADRGPGLLLEDIDKVFEKFYRGQAPAKEKGSGLGLSICQSIVKAHGGRIWAENRWDGGAIFHLLLPLHEETNIL
ncbi:MAG: sensor histidine kinase KdpD [Gammaproteobacteria bacterium]|nr:sensor histidine kinase KdpD [Gammaproteobacteria bacterium]